MSSRAFILANFSPWEMRAFLVMGGAYQSPWRGELNRLAALIGPAAANDLAAVLSMPEEKRAPALIGWIDRAMSSARHAANREHCWRATTETA